MSELTTNDPTHTCSNCGHGYHGRVGSAGQGRCGVVGRKLSLRCSCVGGSPVSDRAAVTTVIPSLDVLKERVVSGNAEIAGAFGLMPPVDMVLLPPASAGEGKTYVLVPASEADWFFDRVQEVVEPAGGYAAPDPNTVEPRGSLPSDDADVAVLYAELQERIEGPVISDSLKRALARLVVDSRWLAQRDLEVMRTAGEVAQQMNPLRVVVEAAIAERDAAVHALEVAAGQRDDAIKAARDTEQVRQAYREMNEGWIEKARGMQAEIDALRARPDGTDFDAEQAAKVMAYERDADFTPIDDGARPTPGQLYGRLLERPDMRLAMMHGLMVQGDQGEKCFVENHEQKLQTLTGTIDRLSSVAEQQITAVRSLINERAEEIVGLVNVNATDVIRAVRKASRKGKKK